MQDGYRYFPGLFHSTLISEAIASVEELCRVIRPGDPRWEKHVFPLSELKAHRNPGISNAGISEQPFLLTHLPLLSPALKALVEFPALWASAREVLGEENIVCHFSNVTRKPAQVGPNISWHRDYPNGYICPKESSDFFRFLVPLEKMDEENGCTLAIPGSHLLLDEEALLEPKHHDLSTAIPLIADAGTAVAIHPKLLHGGKENRSKRNRNLVVIQFGKRTKEFLHGLEEEEIHFFS